MRTGPPPIAPPPQPAKRHRTTLIVVAALAVVACAAGLIVWAAWPFARTTIQTPTGTVWAWGNNLVGMLGDGTEEVRPTPVRVSGLTNVIAIAGGDICAYALVADQ
ncbi:MAG: hypothetical protein LBR19_01225 [Bifidobacteriaceae bacterium]|jgi:alpha-tubulin suppressor-like RCC1 family protein|nr:hypothetical protein [Bifidobacteriaceae bacterium]